jgi:putative membrane protein
MRTEYRGPLIVLGVLVLVVLLMPMLGLGMMGPGMMGSGMMGGYGGLGGQTGGWSWGWGLAMGLGMLAMLAFWGALIVGVVLLVRWLMTATGGSGRDSDETSLEILKRRYAAGEIPREEYAQMRQELEQPVS